jgi:hypothetical protein
MSGTLTPYDSNVRWGAPGRPRIVIGGGGFGLRTRGSRRRPGPSMRCVTFRPRPGPGRREGPASFAEHGSPIASCVRPVVGGADEAGRNPLPLVAEGVHLRRRNPVGRVVGQHHRYYAPPSAPATSALHGLCRSATAPPHCVQPPVTRRHGTGIARAHSPSCPQAVDGPGVHQGGPAGCRAWAFSPRHSTWYSPNRAPAVARRAALYVRPASRDSPPPHA